MLAQEARRPRSHRAKAKTSPHSELPRDSPAASGLAIRGTVTIRVNHIAARLCASGVEEVNAITPPSSTTQQQHQQQPPPLKQEESGNEEDPDPLVTLIDTSHISLSHSSDASKTSRSGRSWSSKEHWLKPWRSLASLGGETRSSRRASCSQLRERCRNPLRAPGEHTGSHRAQASSTLDASLPSATTPRLSSVQFVASTKPGASDSTTRRSASHDRQQHTSASARVSSPSLKLFPDSVGVEDNESEEDGETGEVVCTSTRPPLTCGSSLTAVPSVAAGTSHSKEGKDQGGVSDAAKSGSVEEYANRTEALLPLPEISTRGTLPEAPLRPPPPPPSSSSSLLCPSSISSSGGTSATSAKVVHVCQSPPPFSLTYGTKTHTCKRRTTAAPAVVRLVKSTSRTRNTAATKVPMTAASSEVVRTSRAESPPQPCAGPLKQSSTSVPGGVNATSDHASLSDDNEPDAYTTNYTSQLRLPRFFPSVHTHVDDSVRCSPSTVPLPHAVATEAATSLSTATAELLIPMEEEVLLDDVTVLVHPTTPSPCYAAVADAAPTAARKKMDKSVKETTEVNHSSNVVELEVRCDTPLSRRVHRVLHTTLTSATATPFSSGATPAASHTTEAAPFMSEADPHGSRGFHWGALHRTTRHRQRLDLNQLFSLQDMQQVCAQVPCSPLIPPPRRGATSEPIEVAGIARYSEEEDDEEEESGGAVVVDTSAAMQTAALSKRRPKVFVRHIVVPLHSREGRDREDGHRHRHTAKSEEGRGLDDLCLHLTVTFEPGKAHQMRGLR